MLRTQRGGQIGVIVDDQQGVLGGAQVAQREAQRQLLSLVPQLVAQLQHAGPAVHGGAGDFQRVATARYLRIDDHVQAADPARLLSAHRGADARLGVVQGAAQLQCAVRRDPVGCIQHVQQASGGGSHFQRPAASLDGIRRGGCSVRVAETISQPPDFTTHQAFGERIRSHHAVKARD